MKLTRGQIATFDLEGFLHENGFSPLGNAEWIGYCSKCRKKKLTVNTDKLVHHCWVCPDIRGNLLGLVKTVLGLSSEDAAAFIKSRSDYENYDGFEENPDWSCEPDRPKEEFSWESVDESPPRQFFFDSVPKYLERRGLDMDDIQDWSLSGCKFKSDYGRSRVVFPMLEKDQIVFWTTRAMYEAHEVSFSFVKSMNPKAYSPSAKRALLNLSRACEVGRGEIVLVEGPIDAIKAGLTAVAVCGKKLSDDKYMNLISRGLKKVRVCFDPSALEEAKATSERLETFGIQSSVLHLPDQRDPGDFTKEEFSRWFQQQIDK